MYLLTGLGVTVGFHRLFTHRSFKTSPAVRGLLRGARLRGDRGARDLLGGGPPQAPRLLRSSRAIPHSPHVDHGVGLRGALRGTRPRACGLAVHPHRAGLSRTLRAGPARRSRGRVGRSHLLRVGASAAWRRLRRSATRSAAPWRAGLTGLLWGGAVRMLVLHHMTYSINSLCHFFGRRDYLTDDHSRNLAVARACPPSGRRGTTTTTPSPPPRAMV